MTKEFEEFKAYLSAVAEICHLGDQEFFSTTDEFDKYTIFCEGTHADLNLLTKKVINEYQRDSSPEIAYFPKTAPSPICVELGLDNITISDLSNAVFRESISSLNVSYTNSSPFIDSLQISSRGEPTLASVISHEGVQYEGPLAEIVAFPSNSIKGKILSATLETHHTNKDLSETISVLGTKKPLGQAELDSDYFTHLEAINPKKVAFYCCADELELRSQATLSSIVDSRLAEESDCFRLISAVEQLKFYSPQIVQINKRLA